METLALSVEMAASRVMMGRTFLYKEIRDGRLRARKIGKCTRITIADLEAWLASLPTRDGPADSSSHQRRSSHRAA